ncbi:MAG: hypothetical protein ABJQ85_04385 [Rhizobiaceae bacterium]
MLRKRYLPKVDLLKRFVRAHLATFADEPLILDVNVVFAQTTAAAHGKIEPPLARVF